MRLLLFAWLPISFVLPCLLTYDVAVQQYVEIPGRSKFTKDPDFRKAEDAQNQAVRSGAIGALVAILIFALWQLDSFNRKDNDLKERWAKVVVVALAALLWLVWTFMIYGMFRAYDSVYEAPPQLPGLDSP